jgi:hypothetical protein
MHHQAALVLARQLAPAEPMLAASALNGLGIVCKDTRRLGDAAQLYADALALAERAGSRPPSTGVPVPQPRRARAR